ncbi:ParB/RepB/Spo0J family partition protein [Gleimia sp. 6138-11-ORH1]|uniref:ParB/RepB/Spo0J family partition protein n=1 Tax=Gleimia sp. 6138-11-ORH1 TaxID=2973937 RepID=UPI00216A8BA1|nr:ParB/RepB/Spo0J family partition protein [Gleimia sp. 6138-11-ORH1]MCS4485137.1 ParB/RepB/Spo0J family partition protein [Gleimia sp. 6138-11-ORH1]
MAEKRKALGRGLGSLIPTQESDVPRETSLAPEKAMDVFFPRSNETSKGKEPTGRAGHSAVTADLLKPPARRTQKAKPKKTKVRSQEAGLGGAVRGAGDSPSSADSTSNPRKIAPQNIDIQGIDGPGTDRQRIDGQNIEEDGGGKSGVSGQAAAMPGQAGHVLTNLNLSDEASRLEKTGHTNRALSVKSEDELDLVPVPGARMAVLKIAEIAANLDQPREFFDEEALKELAESVKEIGILQPIVVREISDNKKRYEALIKAQIAAGKPAELKYELIMGERRLRASQLAGLTEIPAIIRDTQDDEMLRDALLENLHRVQLNAIEEAAAYQQLLEEFGCTQEELSQKIKRSRPQISNTIRLLKLPHNVQLKVMANVISMGHARALLGLDSAEKMELLAERIVAEGLSVRTTEELVSLGEVSAQKRVSGTKRQPAPLSIQANYVQERLGDLFDTKVTVEQRKRKGKIIVEFAGEEDLERIAALVQVLKLSADRP